MALRRRRKGGGGLEAWPGYVDALSTLLMVIIFVLLVFVLAQGFLSVALSSRDRALERLNRQVSELSELLALERGQAEELRTGLSRNAEELRASSAAREALARNFSILREERDRLATERESTRAERDRLAARIADLDLAAGGGAARIAELEGRLAEALARAEAAGGDAAATVRTLTDAQRLLAAERAALEAVRRDLSAARDQSATLTRDLSQERGTREATQRELVQERTTREATQRDLAMARSEITALSGNLAAERDQRAQRERELAEARTQGQALSRDLTAERDQRAQRERELAEARTQGQALSRDLAAEREQRAQRDRELAEARAQGQALSRDLTATRQARDSATESLEARRREAEALARDLAAARASLAAAQRDIATLREEAAALDRTVRADRATIEARLSDIARLTDQIRGLEALRDQLERQAAAALARAGDEERLRGTAEAALGEAQRLLANVTGRATTAERDTAEAAARANAADRAAAEAAARTATAERLAGEARQAAGVADARAVAAERVAQESQRAAQDADRARAAATLLATEASRRAQEADRARAAADGQAAEYARLSESARAQVALLTRQLEALRAELARVAATLEAEENAGRDKDVQIVNLGQRLNAALAARVEELQQYRSDFFGRLRRVLGDRPEVRIVGDRFVFQSEVLFPVGGAELSPGGQQQVRDLARVLIDLAAQFPPDLAWVLRVDGHADRSPIRGGGRFASNWELSAARSIAVAQLLMQEGLPANRLAAAAFGDTQPLDDRDTPDAFARNRRIELRLEAGPAGTRAAAPTPARSTQEAIRGLACGRVAELQGGSLVAGIGPRGSQARLRAALPGATPRLAIAEFDGPYCPVLEALRPVEPSAGAAAMRIGLGNGNPVREGDPLLFDLALPDWAAHVTLVYLSSDNKAVTLETLGRQQAGQRLRLGTPRPNFPGWMAEPPFGTDLVLAVASEAPLFATPRPIIEPVQDFATALRGAIAAARAAAQRISADLTVVEVTPR
ncbi:peptidoglycan -binding protein [Falsiroseomonas stagni]|uniref:Chemotaxis protein MotB n=1 Tax=Falsiroseomonas stagni DSM 19981 TaxID=1123062 RepID=A0A1I3Z6L3_9PROT|nr:peptidoglycan -binding protein [Falsiroseomonas stagni]SFK39742.1 chemotaxis protein MotB [Falsiroseomonas stagni DSM 19981]